MLLRTDQWDDEKKEVRKNHPNSTRINNIIKKKLIDAEDLILEKEGKKKAYSASTVITQLKKQGNRETFQEFAKRYLDTLIKQGKIKVAKSENSRVKNFRNFLKDDVFFEDITIATLQKFQIYLSVDLKLKPRSVMNHLICIQALFNRAIKEELITNDNYPFGLNKVKIRIPESIKIGLEPDEIKKIESLHLSPQSPIWHARNVFLFSFFFAGMKISDVMLLKWSDFQKSRLIYRMGKNQKVVSIKIPEKAKKIISFYTPDKKGNDDLIFPEMKTADFNNPKDIERKLNAATSRINKFLKKLAKQAGISKNISNHIARHTFAQISSDKIPIQMLQKLYRHSSMLTTEGYQGNFIHKDVDKALDDVLDF